MNPKTFLTQAIDNLMGIGPIIVSTLKKELHLHTYFDLLNYLPFRYVDRSKFYKINQIQSSDVEIQLLGKISHIKKVRAGKINRLEATFTDDTGSIQLTWFKFSDWMVDKLTKDKQFVVFGKPKLYNQRFSITHPEIDSLSDVKKAAYNLKPIYHSTDGLQRKKITNNSFIKFYRTLFDQVTFNVPETLSQELLQSQQLMPLSDAYRQVHFPKNLQQLTQAQQRIKFDELFFMLLNLQMKKDFDQHNILSYPFEKVGENFRSFYKNHLPFELTNAQKRVIKEIRTDLGTNSQMNRLLQGDVGSGKTIVALLTALLAKDNGFQTCFMAPTEILARQHFNDIKSLLKGLPVKVDILSGSTPMALRKTLFSELKSGEIAILIGTHALIEDLVVFHNLGLVIIDEQHKFGVAQRAKLWTKNTLAPHVLVMTATPIPRTLAMSVYSDLDISIIDELPKGRKAIKTIHQTDKNRLKVLHFIKKEVDKGRQVYVVYPLIEESKNLDHKDLMDGYESLIRSFPLPYYAISIVHGRMKAKDKEYEMQRFAKGETQIMVATTVIEVGVNIPNASLMVIESAEKFGLSQLHQLRGRVGRGSNQSYCILMSKEKLSSTAKLRLKALCESNDGFKIAEVDLEIRGPGNLLGTQQSGLIDFKLVNLATDKDLITSCKKAVVELLKEDPDLQKKENAATKDHYLKYHKPKLDWSRIS